MSDGDANAVLVTSGCTTGWDDWRWGELWLLPEGLLRLSLGWRGVMAALTWVWPEQFRASRGATSPLRRSRTSLQGTAETAGSPALR